MQWLGLVLPFAGALGARLGYRLWYSWLAWVACCLSVFLVDWLAGYFLPKQAIVAVLGASAVGFVAPELWQGLRAILRQPRVVGWLALVASVTAMMTTNRTTDIADA